MRERIWTISNLLSLARLALVVPVVLLLSTNEISHRIYAVTIIVIATLTDYFDGAIARKFKQVTDIGKIVDPLADKIGIGVVSLVLTHQGKLPLWFLIIVLSRDLLIYLGGIYLKSLQGNIIQSNLVGKWTVVIIALVIVFAILNFPELQIIKSLLIYLTIIMIVVSFALYVKRFLNISLTNKQQNEFN
jgi:CDP-diacylglycerol--glycerol-3-phosphate 3-phosphatidyltransferase